MEPVSANSSRGSLLLLASLYLGHASVFGNYVADDAGISLAYARNIAAGYGPVLYAGGEAVEGFSNPLWTAIIALGVALRLDSGDGIPLLKTLGLLFGAGALWLTVLVARRAYPQDHPSVGWLAAAVLALWTPFVFWSGAGLENPLYVCLLLLAVLLQLREADDPEVRPWSALALAGVALTRPEGCAFFVAFLVHRVIAMRERQRLIAWSGIFIAICAGYLALRLLVFGDLLPNTYHAKIADRNVGGIWSYLSTRADPGFAYLERFAVSNVILLAVAVIGFADRRYWRAGLLLVSIGSGTAAYALYVGGDFWPAFRFLTPALPILAIGAQHAVSVIPLRSQYAVGLLLAGAVAYGSIQPSLQLREQHFDDTLIGLQGRLEQGRKVRALATALGVDDPLYLDPDIGGPSVVGLRVLDLAGLTDIHIARFQWYQPFFRAYIFDEMRPHIIRTHSTWTRTSRLTEYPEFHQQYVAVKSEQDSLGLHGEFVRRDLLTAHRAAEAEAPRPASWRQAIDATKARRLREATRERERWIQYYSDRGWHERLRATFRELEASDSLPNDPADLADLYYGLLGAGERAGAERVRILAGIGAPQPLVLSESGRPILSLITSRVLQREMDWARLQVFFEVLQSPPSNYGLQLALRPVHSPEGELVERDHWPTPGTSSWEQGTTVMMEIPLYVPLALYELRGTFSRPSSEERLCHAAGACELLFGTHQVKR